MPLEYALQERENFVDADPWKEYPIVKIIPKSAIGLDKIAQQHVNNSMKKLIPLNLIVVGQSGLGKTTFINTLMKLNEVTNWENLSDVKTTKISVQKFRFKAKGLNAQVNVFDTPGFGDNINRDGDVTPILDLINSKYDEYLENERSEFTRTSYVDGRIHAVLYFVAPNTTGLKELDLKAIKQISENANLIPIIAKTDCLTVAEKEELRKTISEQLQSAKMYPKLTQEQDIFKHMQVIVPLTKANIPFALVGSNFEIEEKGIKKRVRKYKWGIVEVENPEVNDFVRLKEFLLNLQLIDLIETTDSIHYYAYRYKKLRGLKTHQSVLVCDEDYQVKIESFRKVHLEEMSKNEQRMKDNFVKRVREKEAQLRAQEDELERKREELLAPLKMEESQIQQELQELDNLLMGGSKDKKPTKVAAK